MQRSKLSTLPELVRTARAAGLPLRVTEAATLSYGGVQGISDTAGAALWNLDAALEAAAAGAAGINFHQVLGRESNANYNAVDYFEDTGRVRARLPYWCARRPASPPPPPAFFMWPSALAAVLSPRPPPSP